jgi:hypothetical protein
MIGGRLRSIVALRTMGTAHAGAAGQVVSMCAVVAVVTGCAAAQGVRAEEPAALATRSTGQGRPPLTVVTREGDAEGAIAVAVSTEGIGAERGALAAVALAALVQERLSEHGVAAAAVGGWNGWRMQALIDGPAAAVTTLGAVREALLAPVKADEPAMAAVARKTAALAARPLVDAALADVARCTGEAFGAGGDAPPTAADVESWRAAAHGLGRVAIAAAGQEALADAAASALAQAPAWPVASPITAAPWPSSDANAVVYDASGELAPGAARLVVTARTTTPERALAAASLLGDPHGALASRLDALPAPAHLRSVVATAHVDGGCLAATIDLAERDLGRDGPARVATAAVLARQELAVEVSDVTAPADLGRTLARAASDPRDAAERAAWWSLAGRAARNEAASGGDGDSHLNLIVGLAASKDASPQTAAARSDSLRSEIDRATLAWHARVVEARTDVERGQGEVWVLLASPCGTLMEDARDAGTSAAVALAASMQSQSAAGSVRIEPFVAPDGIGVLAHGPRLAGETAEGQARRLADLAARTVAAETVGRTPSARARSALLGQASRPQASVEAALASALVPGHPSWVVPAGTAMGLSSLSDDGVSLRAASLRAGPLRIAVLANVDDAQAKAAVRAADRWIARRPDDARACPSPETLAPARSATYAVERPAGLPAEAILAVPLAPSAADRKAASWLAAALDGPDGWLARALNAAGADSERSPLATAWGAQVLAAPQSLALLVRLTGPDASLDAAVAQTRALFDRLRQGAIQPEDLARASRRLARATLATSLDPRARVVALWRGDAPPPPAPSLEDLRGFAAGSLHDDALVIVAARPPRLDVPVEKGRTRP